MIGEADSQIDGDILLYLRVGDDYLVVDQGTDHVRHVGKDLRGMKISQFNAAVSPVLKELYDEALRTHQAIYCRFVSDLAPNSYFWEGLFLPVCSDDMGGAHFVLNYNRPIDSKADILQMILDRSPVGMIAAVPIGGRDGGMPDGRIISMNARAKAILKLDSNRSRVNYIRELAPWLRDVAKMSRVESSRNGQNMDILYRGEAGQTYCFTVEALKRFILFSIVEQNAQPAVQSSGASSIGS
ncbi:MAG: hypothetical protein FJX62_12510 [Alphaproteobacteria bacterium]|nr:hypothetical protein [Alphaproteobacteria bacterium]